MLKKISFFLISLSITFIGINSAFSQNDLSTYSGQWEGSLVFRGFSKEYSGTWQFEVDFDKGAVEGWFKGDGAGDITGTVSDGIIEASGEAAFGVVQWFGEYASNGKEISGTWKIAEEASEYGKGSGTWSGSLGELEEEVPEEEQPKGLPQEDQTAVDEEVLKRYPGSIAMKYKDIQTTEGSLINIEYVTDNTLDNVVDWYKRELGEPTMEESSAGKVELGYRLDEPAGWIKIEISTNDYTTIEVEHVEAPH